ncbi:Ig-like domain-containing protein [Bdellovibrio sp. HCB185ZH]|uniref:Ig-like domain-containing protein n=1 Tax=Bdellovibrio sp. HCB185ZH TaxID=3394235 RepID=UPI0039A4F072
MGFVTVRSLILHIHALFLTVFFSACAPAEKDDEKSTEAKAIYTFKGTISSPSHSQIKMQLSLDGVATETVTLSDGANNFNFLSKAKSGALYSIAITQQPQSPSMLCTLSNASGTVSANVSVTLSCPALTSFSVTGTKYTTPIAASLTLKATATFSDGQSSDVTSSVEWKSSNTTVASVQSGVVTGLSAGAASIQGAFGGQTVSKNITVTGATLSSVALSPYGPKIGIGSAQNFKLTGTYSDGSTTNLTQSATWVSADPAIAEVNATLAGQLVGKSAGTTTVTASYGGKSANVSIQVTGATLTSLEVSPAIKTIAKANFAQYVATGVYSDNSVRDISDQVTWSVDNPAKASVNTTGLVTGIDSGSVSVKASMGVLNDSALLTITATSLSSIAIQNAPTTLPTGFSVGLKAIGTYADGTTQDITADVLWGSNDESLLSISNESPNNGYAKGLASGSVVVSAELGGISTTKSFSVANVSLQTIAVSPGALLIPKGVNLNWSAQGTFADGTVLDVTKNVNWSSSNPLYAVMSNVEGSNGLMSSIYTGSSTVSFNITATYGAVTATAGMTITPTTLASLVLRPMAITMHTGKTIGMKAYGRFSDGAASDLTTAVKWASSARAIASISNSIQTPGLLSSLAEGAANLSAELGAVSASTAVTVSNSATEGFTNDGVGLTGTYHNGKTLSSLKGSRIDATVDFTWGSGTAPLGVGDNFSIRWSGKIKARYSETYTFCTRSDDGVRLKINGSYVVNNWTDHGETENCGSVALTAGSLYAIEMDFYESAGDSVVRLFWQSPSQAKQIVPQAYLYPN